MISPAPLISREACVARDSVDPLRGFRDRFVLPDGLIYLDGNSLGPMPRDAAGALRHTIEQQWSQDLVRSWNDAGWFDMPVRLGDRVGALIGAAAGETVVCDTTSINLFKAIHAAIALRPDRDVVIAEDEAFPTDLYIVEGAMKSAGRPMSRRLIGTDGPSIEALLDRRVAVAVLSQVNYRTGALLDIAAITRQLHDAGALVVWDLCHSIGVVEIAFDRDAMDFAVGCTYKYLNGGPGSPAFIAVATAHQAAAQHPLSGWWGHAAPFAFDRDFRPDTGIRRFLCGTQPIISLRGVEAALDAMAGVEVAALRQKSLALTELFMARVAALCAGPRYRDTAPGIAARQPGRHIVRPGLCGGPGDDRARGNRRFPRPRPHALWLRAALRPFPGCLGCRRNPRPKHQRRSLARPPLQPAA